MKDGIWERLVPAEWQPYLQGASVTEMAGLAVGLVPSTWPASLHAFVREAQSVQLEPFPSAASSRAAEGAKRQHSSKNKKWRNMTAKKQLEIEQMARCVAETCMATGVQTVVDVG
eukprot:SAG31_NODE_19270_length_607_cov_1.407480_2_plen_114_part_01